MGKLTVSIFLKYPVKIWKLPEGAEKKLKSRFPEVIFHITEEDEEFKKILGESEVLLCWRLKEKFFPFAKRLKWIHTAMAGIEEFIYPQFVESDILLTNSKGVASVGIAEHVIGMMLCLSRKIFESILYQSKGEYGRQEIWENDSIPFEIEGKTMGILGYGSIGNEIASRCKALGMNVIGLRRVKSKSPQNNDIADIIFRKDHLDDLLGNSDFITIALPLTDETRGMIGEKELKTMKKDACLINIARGGIIKEDALIKALNNGWIAGAALDVFEKEPLSADHSFYKMSNVLITPHISGTNPEYMNRVIEIFAENLERYLEGKPLKNMVDKKRGY